MTDLATAPHPAARPAPHPAPPGSAPAFDPRLEEHRRELTAYSYRMLGSAFEAEDAVQETMIRAWRGLAKFDGRSSLRSWMYRIATNVCLDMLKGRKRRALPMDLSAAGEPVAEALGEPLDSTVWVEPIADSRVLPGTADPAETAVARESIRLAFVAALQYLPPRQRAVLILREVLAWSAAETAELLDTTVASVNSALQRARATMSSRDLTDDRPDPMNEENRALLERYVAAFERFDMEALVGLIAEDAVQVMPPFALWMRGRDHIIAWMDGGPGSGCAGSRLLPFEANGQLAFAAYRPSGPGGLHEPFSIQVLHVEDDRIVGFSHFLDTNLFPLFGLPQHPDGEIRRA